MQDRRVARRYAEALFASAKQAGSVPAVGSDLDLLVDLIGQSAGFKHYLAAPYASRTEKLGFFTRVFGGKINALTLSIITIMLERGRETELPAIREEFQEFRRLDEGLVYAKVVSSDTLDDGQKARIADKLAQELGRKVETEFEVDPRLLGGVKVSFDNYVLDGTVRGTLGKLRETLRYNLLKQN